MTASDIGARRFEGRVVFITGAARGQGRSHAVRFAAEGADIIAVDICEQLDTIEYPMATEDDLAETVRMVREQGRRIHARKADVRDLDALTQVVADGVAELGRLDVVVANAGVAGGAGVLEMTGEQWREMIDVDQTGVWHACKAAVPHLVAGARGGAVILTSSELGLRGGAYIAHYVAAKHAVIGLMRSLAIELGPSSIRVNCVLPTEVSSPMLMNEAFYGWLCPDVEDPGPDDLARVLRPLHTLPVPWVEPVDISHAVMFLASDAARYITGIPLPVDAGGSLIR
jgi:(+)-trans-carveol dehydrogenase